ncbi:MAG: hypothetical protein R3F59_01835 [Myxococcota bacterium]
MWNVLPHGALEPVVPGVWVVRGSLPDMPLPRYMVACQRGDELLLHSPICLDEPGMAALEALGRPTTLIVPNGGHRLDAPAFRERYPEAKLLAPAAARAKVEEKVPVDATCEEAVEALGLRWHAPPGFVPGYELVYEVPGEGGVTLVVNDVLANVTGKAPGLSGFVLGLLGVPGGGFGRPRIVSLRFGRDRGAFKPWLEAQAAREDLVAITTSHGPPVVGRAEVKAKLAEAASKL